MITKSKDSLQLNKLYQFSKDYVFLVKQVGDTFTYVYVNPAAQIIFDGDPFNKTLEEAIVNKQLLPEIKRNYQLAIQKQREITYRDFYLFSNTKYKNETTVLPVIDGQSCYILAITKEISAQKQLEEQNHFLLSLFDNQPRPIIVFSSDFTIIKANESAREYFGIAIDVNFEKAFMQSSWFSEKNKIKFHLQLLAVLEGEEKINIRFGKMNAFHEEVDFFVTFSPVKLGDEVVAISTTWQPYNETISLIEDLKQSNQELQSYKYALDVAASFCMTDADGVIQYASKGYEELTGYRAEELIGKNNSLLNSHKQPLIYYKNLWATIKKGETWRGEFCNRTKNGRHYWVDTTIVPIYNNDFMITNFLSICIDITDKRQMMTNLRNVERTFKLITENTNDFIVITNEDDIILYVSPNHGERLGYSLNEMRGRFYSDLLEAKSYEKFRYEIETTLKERGDVQVELQLQAKSGGTVWIEAHITKVEDPNRDNVFQYVSIAREITDRKKRDAELHFMAYHDSLTKLPNRRYLVTEFEKIIDHAKANDTSVILLYVDGDNFKAINDIYGHDVGDIFICEFGQALRKSIRDNDMVVRVGGDEFIIVLTNTSLYRDERKQQIRTMVNRIQHILHKGWKIGNDYFSPTSSIGVSSYPENGTQLEQLMDAADEALYIAKRVHGKDSYYISKKRGGE